MVKIRTGTVMIIAVVLAASVPGQTFGLTIPLAEQGKLNAGEHVQSPVIEVIGLNWELTPLSNGPGDVTTPADGKIIPVAEGAREHVYGNAQWHHSPVITQTDGVWILTPLANATGLDNPGFDVSVGAPDELPEVVPTQSLIQEQVSLNVTTVPSSSSYVVTPEPATLLLLGLGAVALVRRSYLVSRKKINQMSKIKEQNYKSKFKDFYLWQSQGLLSES